MKRELTYADQAKRIQRKYKDRTDKLSMDSMHRELDALEQEQETIRAQMNLIEPQQMAAWGGPGGYVNQPDNNLLAMGGMIKRADGSYSKKGLWDNIRANKGSGKKPTAEMLEQEKKIKAEYAMGGMMYATGGGIHIDPSKKGTFTAAATKHGKSVQGFASQVLANKENYSPAMVKKANFAKNASKWKHADGGPMSSLDSIAHQADKILKYEQLRGGPGGTPLPYYADPQYKDMLMNKVYPEVKKIMPNANAMESAEAMDFIFNSGRDPRTYMLDQYLKSKGQSGIPNRSSFNIDMNKDPEKWKKKKPELDAIWNQYSPEINKLPVNTRRQFLNKGRDWYYQNIDNPSPGVPNSNYADTWYGRIWNTNDYNEFNPNNPKFTPAQKAYGGPMGMYFPGTGDEYNGIPYATLVGPREEEQLGEEQLGEYKFRQDPIAYLNKTLQQPDNEELLKKYPSSSFTKDLTTPNLKYQPTQTTKPTLNKPFVRYPEQELTIPDLSYKPNTGNSPFYNKNYKSPFGTGTKEPQKPEQKEPFNYLGLTQLAGPLMDLYYGIKGPDKVNFDRVRAEQINLAPQTQADLIRRGSSLPMYLAKQQGLGQGNYLNTLAALSGKTGENIGKAYLESKLAQEQFNAQAKTGANAANAQIAMQESIARQQEKDAARSAVTKGAGELGKGISTLSIDPRLESAQSKQNKILKALLASQYPNTNLDFLK